MAIALEAGDVIVADLHVHTANSDGTLTLARLPEAADRAGVSAVAVTDHDRLHPGLSRPVARLENVTVVHGIELRVEAHRALAARSAWASDDDPRRPRRVDLLGYGARRTRKLVSLIDRLQTDRIERGREIIDRVEDRLGVELPIEPREGLGRPHIARAIEAVSDYSYQEAFDELIGDDGPCFVPREVPTFEEGVDVLGSACSLVALAHPYRYDDPEATLELCVELDAVERFYPYEEPIDPRPIDRAIERYDLLAVGGSDAHGEELGAAGLERAAYRRFRAAL